MRYVIVVIIYDYTCFGTCFIVALVETYYLLNKKILSLNVTCHMDPMRFDS